MYIEKRSRKDGSVVYFVRVKHKGKSYTKTLSTKAMAVNWGKKTKSSLELDLYSNTSKAKKITISDLLDIYAKEIAVNHKSDFHITSIKIIKQSSLANINLSELTKQDVLDWVNKRLRSVKSETVRKDLQPLKLAIDAAINLWGYTLPSNPVTDAKKALTTHKVLKPGVHRDRRFSVDELQSIYNYQSLKPTNIQLIVEFAVETAMRRGEIANARWEHKDGNTLLIPETKTDKPRTIPLSKRVREILSLIYEESGGSGLIFNVKADSISQAFGRVCKSLEIEDARFHDLRHEATSRFFEKGLSIEQVASITGHADWASLKRYTHIKPESLVDLL